MTKLVEGNVEGARCGEQPATEPDDVIVTSRLRPEAANVSDNSFDPISGSQSSDVAKQRPHGWWQPPIDSISPNQRQQSIEVPAHPLDTNGVWIGHSWARRGVR
jgi:hypothetical protein